MLGAPGGGARKSSSGVSWRAGRLGQSAVKVSAQQLPTRQSDTFERAMKFREEEKRRYKAIEDDAHNLKLELIDVYDALEATQQKYSKLQQDHERAAASWSTHTRGRRQRHKGTTVTSCTCRLCISSIAAPDVRSAA